MHSHSSHPFYANHTVIFCDIVTIDANRLLVLTVLQAPLLCNIAQKFHPKLNITK